MHELSIAMNIVDLATDAVKKASARRVDVIELDIGTLAGIQIDALDFAWSIVIKGTVLNDAERIINTIQAIAKCSRCGSEFIITDHYQTCPVCGDISHQLTKGRELKIKSLVVS